MMKIEGNISKVILDILENKDFLKKPLNESYLNFKFVKITDPELADNIFNHTLSETLEKNYQEWDIVRSEEINKMDALYMDEKNDIYSLTTKIFKLVGNSFDSYLIINSDLNEHIPYLVDSIFDDFTKIIFNNLTNQNNEFFNKILQVYLAGGWPCGWEGQYPDGHLVVFSNE